MKARGWNGVAFVGGLLLVATAIPGSDAPRVAAAEAKTKVLVVAGPSKHPPGTHEAAAGARLVAYCLEHAQGVKPIQATVVSEWPKDPSAFQDVATIVFFGDLFPAETLDDPAKVKADLAALMDRGCGIVCVHYATGLRGHQVASDGDHPLLHWTGGYFATAGCTHHRSVTRVCTATLSPTSADHPVLRGWKEFTFHDEPYWNNYFGPNGPSENVTALVTSMLPPESPKKETIAWAIERPDGGRGLGIVVPHFFSNWKLDDLRILVLNSVCWSAKLDIPAEGVKSSLPDLATFEPASVEPKARPQKKKG